MREPAGFVVATAVFSLTLVVIYQIYLAFYSATCEGLYACNPPVFPYASSAPWLVIMVVSGISALACARRSRLSRDTQNSVKNLADSQF